MTEPFTHPASRLTPPTAIDGDTFGVTLLLMPPPRTQELRTRIRLAGYDTPEKRSPASPFEKRQAFLAAAVTKLFVGDPGQLWCQIIGADDFGRDLAVTYHEIDGIQTMLGEALLDLGLATRWPTRWWQQHDPNRNRTT